MKARTFTAFLVPVKEQQFWMVYNKFSSPLAILWLTFCLSRVHTRCAIKPRTLPEVAQGLEASRTDSAEDAASWLEASCRYITSPRIVLHHYQLCFVVYISSLHASTYLYHVYLLLPQRASSQGLVHVKTFKVHPFVQCKWSSRSSSAFQLEESAVSCCCYVLRFSYTAILNKLRNWTFRVKFKFACKGLSHSTAIHTHDMWYLARVIDGDFTCTREVVLGHT